MEKTISIRRENKNHWERRAPLVPEDVKELKDKFEVRTIVQPSDIRVYSNEEYKKAGAEISEDLSRANVIFAIKEIPNHLLGQDKTYVFFSHTIKGQDHNMGMLRRMMDLKINLIDYEKILNEKNQRLIFFGGYAGLAGMLETFHAFGQKLRLQGLNTPFEKVKQPYEYASVDDAIKVMREIGEIIKSHGLPAEIRPLIVGFAGYGHVSNGAQEIFDQLPHKTISPRELKDAYSDLAHDPHTVYKVVFKEEHLVKPLHGDFDLQDYYDNPDRYQSVFEDYLPYLQILVNCIYWTEDYPRLVTKKFLKANPHLNLKVIGDISCDIDGSIEITHQATMPDEPCFTYFPQRDAFENGVQKDGVTVMAVDNLPCEFPRESSLSFSTVLKDFINELVAVDFNRDFEDLTLHDHLKKALILHKGVLTEDYKYMKDFLK